MSLKFVRSIAWQSANKNLLQT